MLTANDIRRWLERGQAQGATHVIVVCDTFDYSHYPVMVMPDEDVRGIEQRYRTENMQRVMEVYCLHADWDAQLALDRAFVYATSDLPAVKE